MLVARVRSDMRAIYAGRSKKAAATAVCTLFYVYMFTNISLFTGRRQTRDAAVKEEPKSPGKSAPSKRKAYSITGSNPIGHIEPCDDELDPPQGSSKRQKTGTVGTPHVRFDGIMVPNNPRPAPRPTRKSTRSTKANPKSEMGALYERLGREFQAIAKTYADIAEASNTDA
jgi:hypothetical protein